MLHMKVEILMNAKMMNTKRNTTNITANTTKIAAEKNSHLLKIQRLNIPKHSVLLLVLCFICICLIQNAVCDNSTNSTSFLNHSFFNSSSYNSSMAGQTAGQNGSSLIGGQPKRGLMITEVVCGNGVCEIAEDSNNCPFDCKKGPIDFSINLPTEDLESGNMYTYLYTLQNNENDQKIISLRSNGMISEIIMLNDSIKVDAGAIVSSSVMVDTKGKIGVYQGDIEVSFGKKAYYYPVTINVKKSSKGDDVLKGFVSLKILNKEIIFGSRVSYQIQTGYSSLSGETKELGITYGLYKVGNSTPIMEEEDYLVINKSYTELRYFDFSQYSLSEGDYYIEAKTEDADFPRITVDTFKIKEILLSYKQLKVVLIALGIFILVFSIAFGIYKYRKYNESKSRYLLPNFSKIPSQTDDSYWIGKIGSSEHRAYFDPSKLTTHMLVAGSTGSGKSVTASVIVEEALLKKIPVVIFDPTAQWTGFVKACNDEFVLKRYKQFNMNTDDVRPFKGLIYHVKTPDIKLDFKKYMNPGEVTVFNLNDLKGESYDAAVGNIISSMFSIHWEEYPDLRLLVVFDEVHRLLTANGGKVGYLALEKACREFRKWGIGLIMVSQVSSDFKEAVGGNVLTEVQLNTKSMTDIDKIKSKYGEEFAKRITRLGIGVGIIQNPHFNEGKPWFISFRPPLHSPHKIVEEELEMYDKYSRELDSMEETVLSKQKKGVDTSDVELELKLARDKLKEGRFKMAEVYVDSLRNTISKL